MDTEEYLNKLFVDAGWHEGRVVTLSGLKELDCPAHSYAVKLLSEYGNLSVGEVGSGRECAASDIRFFDRPRYEANELSSLWKAELGVLVGVASAHRDHIMLFVGSDGNFYIFTDPDEKLYFGGSFKEVTSKLLLGLNYGTPIRQT